MAVGLLVAATTGLCSLVSAGYLLRGVIVGLAGIQTVVLYLGLILLGLLAATIGWWMFRRGLARMREG